MIQTPFIAVEGPIGVGKTSLAQAISAHYQFKLLKEIVDENPFLSHFYEDITGWSFQTEMFFLCNRFKQLEDIQDACLSKSKPVVADYHIMKNLIFASRTLSASQHEKYVKIYQILTENMIQPNVVIYLSASLGTLQQRISRRGRAFETLIEEQYLQQINADYEDYIRKFELEHPEIPVLRIDGNQVDFVGKPQDLRNIFSTLDQILYKEKATREFS